jgi:hypothetical protein
VILKKVLLDLYPCFDGFAGIPQDTRVSLGLLTASDKYDIAGHLFDEDYGTSGFVWVNHKLMSQHLYGI